MKRKRWKKISFQFLFNLFSILFLLSTGIYFISRFIYYKLESEKVILPSTLLSERLIEEDYGNYFESDNDLSYVNGIYRYVGNATYNYVRYKGFLWRVIKINEDHSVTLITESSVTSLPYENSLESFILPWLNQMEEKNSGIMEISLEDNNELINTKFCTDTFSKLEEATCFDSNSTYKIGILSVYDYLEANANESYLNNGEIFWTANPFDETNSWFISEDGRLSYDTRSNKYGIRPVITISGDSIIYSGNGSADNPYVLNEESPKTLGEAYVGEYLLFQEEVWKIVSKEDTKIKIVKEDCLKDSTDTCITMEYGSTNEKSTLMNYLNTIYYSSLTEKELVVKGPFYNGEYSLIENDYRDSFQSSSNFYIGLLAIGEIFAYEIEDTFLLNTTSNNEFSIYSVKNHAPYQNIVTTSLVIRPSLYLDSNSTILKGNGGILSPYELGGTL